MLKKLLPIPLIFILLLSACGTGKGNQKADDHTGLSIVATTYPLYLFASEVTKGVEGVTVSPLVNQQTSCLHNYTLTVNDMKLLEGANVILMNGAGLDSFLSNASLSNQNRLIVDCSTNIPPLYTKMIQHEGEAQVQEDKASEMDPHFWMDPGRAVIMMETITNKLAELDPSHEQQYRDNLKAATSLLNEAKETMRTRLSSLPCRELITFHDGFSYFADAFDLTILMSVEEEEGQEASAQVISDAISLIDAYKLPAIFTEVNSSDATAKAISREAGVKVASLSMIMSGKTENPGIGLYITAMEENVNTIVEAFQ